jgi:hypothetical protein
MLTHSEFNKTIDDILESIRINGKESHVVDCFINYLQANQEDIINIFEVDDEIDEDDDE